MCRQAGEQLLVPRAGSEHADVSGLGIEGEAKAFPIALDVMIHHEHEAAGTQPHGLGELPEVGGHERGGGKAIDRQVRRADIDDRDGKIDHRRLLRQRHGVGSGAEDDELGRRGADLEEDLAAADVLGTRLGDRRTQLLPGTRDRFPLYRRVGQASHDLAGSANQHSS